MKKADLANALRKLQIEKQLWKLVGMTGDEYRRALARMPDNRLIDRYLVCPCGERLWSLEEGLALAASCTSVDEWLDVTRNMKVRSTHNH